MHEDEDKAQSVAKLLEDSETQLKSLHQQIGNLEKELIVKDEENGRIYKEKMRKLKEMNENAKFFGMATIADMRKATKTEKQEVKQIGQMI